MDLRIIILSSLNKKDMTGYDISKSFRTEVVGFIWRASHQQIYRELGKLERQGFASHKLFPQAGKPDRKVYSITKSGKEFVKKENMKYKAARPVRDSLCSCLYAADAMGDMTSFRQTLQDEIDVCLKEIELVEKEQNERKGLTKLESLMFTRRLDNLQCRVNWAEQAIMTI